MADNSNDNKSNPPAAPQSELEALKAQIAALQAGMAGLTANKAVAEAKEQAATDNLTETIPGGAYFLADGKTLVNAYGRRIDKEGKPLSNDDAYLERALR